MQLTKVIDREDFDSPELVPYLREIAYDETVKFGLSDAVILPDSKQWECALMLKAFDEYEVLKPGAMFAGIGAGVEQTSFALAARDCVVFPTDRYLEQTPWSDVAPPDMMVRPGRHTNFKYNRGSLIPVHADARSLPLPSNFFDGVYSAGSIEHFGSLEAVAASAEEIGRVLKPGGIATISTEFWLDGPNDRPWFDQNVILFTPELIKKWIVEPSGLELVGDLPSDSKPSAATYDGRVVLVDFLAKAASIKSLKDKLNAYPNLVLYHDGFLFCSVHLTLKKPEKYVQHSTFTTQFRDQVDKEAAAAAGVLLTSMSGWRQRYEGPVTEGQPLALPVNARKGKTSKDKGKGPAAELARIKASRSWRVMAPLRALSRGLKGRKPPPR